MYRLLWLVALGFNLWMFVDALRRRADTYWLWIIMGIPGGSLAYFFVVKLRDRDMQTLKRRLVASLEKPLSVDVLRRRFEESPSFTNQLMLAQALADAGELARSRSEFRALLEKRPEDPDALYGLGVCELELGETEAAIAALSTLIEVHPTYREYAAWPELCEALGQKGRDDEALERARELVRRAPRLPHQVLLANHLGRAGMVREGRELLGRALREHEESPRHIRRANRAWAREAERMLTVSRGHPAA